MSRDWFDRSVPGNHLLFFLLLSLQLVQAPIMASTEGKKEGSAGKGF